MTDKWRHLQLRLSVDMRNELEELSEKLDLSASDVIRGSLLFGMPVFAALTAVQDELVKRLVSVLKKEARKDKSLLCQK